jgi:centromeric protein E
METQGINVEMDQWRNSVDSALSFIDELFQNLCIMAQGIRVWYLILHDSISRLDFE